MDIKKKCQPHLWLLTGTGEGHVFAKSLLKEGWKITVSVVSERASLPYKKLPLENILIGPLGSEDEIRNIIINGRNNQTGFHCVVDLTHPFAIKITPTISRICKELDQPYIRYERPLNDSANAFLIKNFCDLANYDLENKSILLAIGIRKLQEAIPVLISLGAKVYARVLANPESLKRSLSSSILNKNCAVLNPSVSKDGKIEKALIRKWSIDGVICRQSGGANEKLWHQICENTDIDLWLLERPPSLSDINSIDNYEKLRKRLKYI